MHNFIELIKTERNLLLVNMLSGVFVFLVIFAPDSWLRVVLSFPFLLPRIRPDRSIISFQERIRSGRAISAKHWLKPCRLSARGLKSKLYPLELRLAPVFSAFFLITSSLSILPFYRCDKQPLPNLEHHYKQQNYVKIR